MASEQPTETSRELGTKPVAPLFARYSLVALAGMSAQAVMVIAEGMIIGNGLGAPGLALVGVIIPLALLNLAIGGALGMGTATVAGNHLGAGDEQGAQKAFSRGFWFAVYLSVAIALVFMVFSPQIAGILGATRALAPQVTLFIRVYMCFLPFCVSGQLFAAVLRVDEKPGIASAFAFLSATVSVAWLYFTVFIARLGIVGLGVYFGLSLAPWFLMIFYFLASKKTVFTIRFADMSVPFALSREIVSIGLPTFLVQVASLVYTIVMNNYLGALGGELEISAFAILNSFIVYILNLIVLSATYGVQPITSFNYGAKHYRRLRTLIKVSLISTAVAVAIASALCIVFRSPIASVFVHDDPALIALAAEKTIPLCIGAAFGGLAMLMSTYFQSVEKIVPAVLLGVCRYLFFTVPVVVIMAYALGERGVWWAQPIADVFAFAFTMFFVGGELRRLKRLCFSAAYSKR